jgi:hypothetical protein
MDGELISSKPRVSFAKRPRVDRYCPGLTRFRSVLDRGIKIRRLGSVWAKRRRSWLRRGADDGELGVGASPAHRIKRKSVKVWRGFWDEERERVQADSTRALRAAQARRGRAEQSDREGEDGPASFTTLARNFVAAQARRGHDGVTAPRGAPSSGSSMAAALGFCPGWAAAEAR